MTPAGPTNGQFIAFSDIMDSPARRVPDAAPLMVLGDLVESSTLCPVCRYSIGGTTPMATGPTPAEFSLRNPRDSGVRTCRRCDTAHHADCWELLGDCSRYGCGATATAGRSPGPYERSYGAHPVHGRDIQYSSSRALESDRTGRPVIVPRAPVDRPPMFVVKTFLEVLGFIACHAFELYFLYFMMK